MWSHRFFKSQGRRFMDLLSRPSEDLIPQVVTGKRVGAIAFSNLTLGIALDALAQTSLGFHRFEPVIGIVSPLPWAMLLTRQGISLIDVIDLLSIFFQITVRFSLGSHPACRHADRTISSPMRIGVWRVVSEDSD